MRKVQHNEIYPPLSHRTVDIYGAMKNLFLERKCSSMFNTFNIENHRLKVQFHSISENENRLYMHAARCYKVAY